jgi:hypothetical protein
MSQDRVQRRDFLQCTAVTGAAWAAASISAAEESRAAEPAAAKSSVEVIETKTDVLVVGGGTAGTVAAIQAARAGARTVLIEQNSQLGGTMTVGGVAFPGLFHAWGKQVIAGIGWDLVRETVELDGGSLPDFANPPGRQHWLHQVLINPFLYSVLAEQACLEAGVAVCYYEFPLAVESTADGWLVDVVGPGTRRRVVCSQLIDCTGGADVVGLMGLPRLRDEETQPGSMLFKFGEAFKAGRERMSAVYVHGADSSNSVTRTQANVTGRREILNQLRARHARGEKNVRLGHIQPEAAFRESYRIQGHTVVTHDDYVSGRVFDDAISYAFYPVDLHTRTGVVPKPLQEGVVPTVPLGALVPAGSRRLIVAGRSISSDRLANSALRVQAICMAIGQAAGAAAALAAQGDSTPLDVPLASIRELLQQHGAIVPATKTG